MNARIFRLYKDLIWPAIAGNVLWSLIHLGVSEGLLADNLLRSTTLGILCLYLFISWSRSVTKEDDDVKGLFLFLDGIYAVCLAVFAVATGFSVESAQGPIAGWTLTLMFTVLAVGYWAKVWYPGPIKMGMLVVTALTACVSAWCTWMHFNGFYWQLFALGKVFVIWLISILYWATQEAEQDRQNSHAA